MRILMVSAVDSPHTQQWVSGLANLGLEIGIFSLRALKENWVAAFPKVEVLYARHPRYFPALGLLNNVNLFTYNKALRHAIDHYRPDIIHAHNLGNHGLIAARANRHPLVLSAWGSDIFEHPHKSPLHRYWTKYTLAQADRILATSKVLAQETQRFCSQKVDLTPFGIDVQHFQPRPVKQKFSAARIVIGSVKSLKDVYNHPLTLRAFALLRQRRPELPLELFMVGDGPQMAALKKLATDLGIAERVTFAGRIPYAQIPDMLAEIDIFVNVSKRESFGVSVLEASAMEIPVIATRVEGLPEVVDDEASGFLIPPDDKLALCDRLEQLASDADLRQRMGKRGRAFVLEHYEKQHCLEKMRRIYQELLNTNQAV